MWHSTDPLRFSYDCLAVWKLVSVPIIDPIFIISQWIPYIVLIVFSFHIKSQIESWGDEYNGFGSMPSWCTYITSCTLYSPHINFGTSFGFFDRLGISDLLHSIEILEKEGFEKHIVMFG